MQDNDRFRVIGTRTLRQDAIDKVLGRAQFGADMDLPNAIHGHVLRSPHAHAKILNIDTTKAAALKGVLAIVTSADFPHLRPGGAGDVARENLAYDKVLFHGHAVAAVAATTEKLARQALSLIDVDYEVLPPVLNIDQAMADDAPRLHDDLGVDEFPAPSNVYEKMVASQGDVALGFAEADLVREREYSTPTVHQGYIEPTACLAVYQHGGQSSIWATTQGHFQLRDTIALMCGMQTHELKVIPTEIGGGFGGKTMVYLEAIALQLSKQSGRPVKMRMTRDEVMRCAGPGAASRIRVKLGLKRDGTITAMEGHLLYDSGAYPGAPLGGGVRSIFSAYDVPHQYVEGYSVVTNKPRVRAYRGPGASQACFATESLLNELASELGLDPLEVRLKNVVRSGGRNVGGAFNDIGFFETLTAARDSEHYRSPVTDGCARAVAVGFWRNGGGPSSARIQMHRNGHATVSTGSADLSGTRESLAMIAAEALQVPRASVSAHVGDTESVGWTGVSGGSRTINATGQAVHLAALDIIGQLKQRAASGWNVRPDQVEWRDGAVHNVARNENMTLREITRQAMQTGGPLTADASVDVEGGQSPCLAVHICDVAVDVETGKVTITRYTTVQDAGRAIHPDYVEGQYQGGAAQGIGWALNEEYVYDNDGVLQNASFLDYRMPVASDLPMIETIIVEVPSKAHMLGVRGVGEAPIIPPLAAVASAVSNAIGKPITRLPCSPVNVLSRIHDPQK